METIYKIEISNDFGVIIKMKSNGRVIDSEEVPTSQAMSFARLNGLSCMEDDGEVKCYW